MLDDIYVQSPGHVDGSGVVVGMVMVEVGVVVGMVVVEVGMVVLVTGCRVVDVVEVVGTDVVVSPVKTL